MQEPQPTGIIQSTEQSNADLHQKTQGFLKQLGHSSSTVPPQETPVLTGEAKQWVEDMAHDATHIAQVTVNPEESAKIRLAKGKSPIPIAIGRWLKKQGSQQKKAA
ncbi:hypothetical protein HY383_04790 [Candidatus Daviesbacteria bacterium]|nr:hypothetical protein [Candidatus Daviesbacteria bacterium]